MTRSVRARVEAVREDGSATTLELFFDLVFVFALTQVTTLMAAHVSWHTVLRGVLVLAVVWWCWVGYSWLSNVVKADEGLARVAMFVAMLAMFVIALTIPESFDDLPGGLPGPTVFAIGYLVLRTTHVVLFYLVSGADPALRRQVLKFLPTMLGGTALLLVAAQTSGTAQTLFWVAAVAADYGGTLAIGSRGWRLNSAKHFAERHGLMVIIAVGESVVAIGVGVTALPISWPIVVAAGLGLAVSASLWWAYFDTAALAAEQALTRARGEHRVAMARSAYTYLHFALVVGIVLVALGLKKVLGYVGGDSGHTLSDKLYGVPLWAMYGGAALYLLAHVAFAVRTYGHAKVQRLVVAVLLIALVPLVANVPALASLGVLAAVLLGLVLFESLRFAAARDEIRHAHEE